MNLKPNTSTDPPTAQTEFAELHADGPRPAEVVAMATATEATRSKQTHTNLFTSQVLLELRILGGVVNP